MNTTDPTPPPGHPPAPAPDTTIRARAARARLLARVAAAGRGETDGVVQRELRAGVAASVAASRALPMLRLEDVAGDALEAATEDGPNCIARISYDVWDEFYGRHRASVGLDRAHATDLRDWLTRLLGDAPPATCGESSGPWREDEHCLLPAGHEGWHKALAATWAPGISRAEWSAIAADEAASYTWVPTPTEQARIDATLAYAGQHNAGESPAEVLAFADELDTERDAAAKEGL